jgi:hypothetical protein
MIDYEKIEKARQLCAELPDHWFEISFCQKRDDSLEIEIRLCHSGCDANLYYKTIDELIEKLENLADAQCNFKVDDTIWFVGRDAKIQSMQIHRIQTNGGQNKITLHDFEGFVDAERAYHSKEELIQAQIDYWHSQR